MESAAMAHRVLGLGMLLDMVQLALPGWDGLDDAPAWCGRLLVDWNECAVVMDEVVAVFFFAAGDYLVIMMD